jgi:uncharacterized protein DUF6460
MDGNTVNRFFGGAPAAVILRLIALSFVLGVVLSALGITPFDIVDGLRDLVWRIYTLGFSSLEWIVRYFLLGAVIVFPIWLIARLLRLGRRPTPMVRGTPGPQETIIPPRR